VLVRDPRRKAPKILTYYYAVRMTQPRYATLIKKAANASFAAAMVAGGALALAGHASADCDPFLLSMTPQPIPSCVAPPPPPPEQPPVFGPVNDVSSAPMPDAPPPVEPGPFGAEVAPAAPVPDAPPPPEPGPFGEVVAAPPPVEEFPPVGGTEPALPLIPEVPAG
jgi:hypothetical protein